MQAIMLAAGMGKRLGKFTNNNTKCMVEVAGQKLIDRAIDAVKKSGIKRFIIVLGYKGQAVIDYIQSKYKSDLEFIFINNKDYEITNNIYSFYMAKKYLEEDDTILMESDLIYDESVIKKIVFDSHKDIAVIAKYKSWMDGTVVKCNKDGKIEQFIDKNDINFDYIDQYYKTVNIYKFSKEFCKNVYIPFLEAYMKAYGLNSYYETILKAVAHLNKTNLFGYEMGSLPWYEIDDAQDLDIANVMFSKGEIKYKLMMSKFGGYWRYDSVLDYCYLVNPYFPTKSFIIKLQKEFPTLLGAYPSGLDIQNMNAERIYGVDKDKFLVGNGAAELINAFGMHLNLKGNVKIGVCVPTFNEYVRCFSNCEIKYVDNSKWDYQPNILECKKIIKYVDYLFIVSPDNPSGAMFNRDEIFELLDVASQNNTTIVVDESFIDFACKDKKYTLLNNEILENNKNLVVIKSIGKSYGVAGLRLGVLASDNKELLNSIRNSMQIWNINSFAEYYLQTFNLFAKSYENACEQIVTERNYIINELNSIRGIKVYDSESNFIMIDLQNNNSTNFCVRMLDEFNILIKDLSTKNYFNAKNFIRIAVRDRKDNEQLVTAFKNILE